MGRRQVAPVALARKGIVVGVLRALMELISGLQARVVAGQAESFEYAMLDTLPEGKVQWRGIAARPKGV